MHRNVIGFTGRLRNCHALSAARGNVKSRQGKSSQGKTRQGKARHYILTHARYHPVDWGDNRTSLAIISSLSVARPRASAATVTSPISVPSMDAVCSIEQARARQHLAHHESSGDNLGLERRKMQTRDMVVHELHTLLHSRGTLCSESRPCTVRPLLEGRNDSLEVCLSTPASGIPGGILCQASPNLRTPGDFFLLKACARGVHPHCFQFSPANILNWAGALQRSMDNARNRCADNMTCSPTQGSPRPKQLILRQRLERCAVVLSGHSLKCGLRSWASRIDSLRYQAVFRTNHYPSAVGAGGVRTDVAYNRCERAGQIPRGASCVTNKWLEWASILQTRNSMLAGTGLGIGHSGGMVTDVAIASCQNIDVFGAGMFSRGGPNADIVYQHWYDSRLTPHCRSPCLSQLKGLVNGTSPSEWQVSRRFCQPKKACDAFNLTNAAASEAPIDFYFLSELRLAVLHVLGLISWKWY